MNYTPQEVIQYVDEENIQFIRLSFCDLNGRMKNIAVMPWELPRIFSDGAAIDASAIAGFGGDIFSDLFLHPDPSTLSSLPWRAEHGGAVRMFCDIAHPDGTPFEGDCRRILKKAISAATEAGYSFAFGAEMEFYLFQTDEFGNPTKIPWDNACYMDAAPHDRGENIRREICLTLAQMGILPESSHHEEGPGQNEIDFRYAEPLSSADNATTFRNVVEIITAHNGLWADFSPKPLANHPGNGLHINLSVQGHGDPLPSAIAGILHHVREMSVFLNPTENSYARLGQQKAPRYLSWSSENRSQLIRIPAARGPYRRAELRSPDPTTNLYLAYALLIYASLDGIQQNHYLPTPANYNLFTAPPEILSQFQKLPESLQEAKTLASQSNFLHTHLPASVLDYYCR